MKNTFDKIIWAVDPFSEDRDLQKRCAETINAVAGDKTEVEPVSILHWDERFSLSEPANVMEELGERSKAAVRNILRAGKLKNSLPPVILTQQDLSLSRAILRVLEYATSAGADLIAVGTQARKGATKFLLGSFAESLILRSTIPVLIVSPRTKPIKKLRRIIFPTDFSEKSKEAFEKVQDLAEGSGASVTIFHQVDYGPVTPSNFEALKSDRSWREREGQAFLQQAKENGLNAEFVVEAKPRSAASAILALSQEPETLIAMVSSSNTVESLLLGSTTRQVIRRASCPVWVIHPRTAQKR